MPRLLRGEDNPPPPDAISAEIMAVIDAMPPIWRRLVHEYGFTIVNDLYAESTYQGARDDLETWRERRQEEIAQGLVAGSGLADPWPTAR
jgi:hypothetical protein